MASAWSSASSNRRPYSGSKCTITLSRCAVTTVSSVWTARKAAADPSTTAASASATHPSCRRMSNAYASVTPGERAASASKSVALATA
ncbi:hypothetical protein BU14_0686s0015 [Porphyra umbilicalis]|uniref:Uncharacterized protein n=1 Tax=Porphyra umbilicalis TaxID=2786 RepID=A0A1X6NQQ1_PORUM|nr:hypothetical protein BU14_0686s0015 [Porphyra umbilicalis]|eukprot:OSX70713.1 hypothetical protein BU14_0686s0015 [Porphyra umbilicalis]